MCYLNHIGAYKKEKKSPKFCCPLHVWAYLNLVNFKKTTKVELYVIHSFNLQRVTVGGVGWVWGLSQLTLSKSRIHPG